MEVMFLVGIFLFLLLSFWRQHYAFFLLPALFATYLWKVTLFGIPWNFLEVLLYVSTVVWLLRMCVLRRNELLLFFKKECTWDSPLLIWGVVVLLSMSALLWVPKQVLFQTGLATSPQETFQTQRILFGIIKTWMIPSWCFLVLLRYFITEQIHKHKILLSYTLGATLVAFLSMWLKYGVGIIDTIDDRLGGIFVSANYLAFYTIPALMYVIIALFEGSVAFYEYPVLQKHYKRMLWLMLPILALTTLLVKSYAGWISVFLCLGVFAVTHCTKKQLAVLLLGSCIAIGGLISIEVGTKKFTTFFEVQSQSSTSTRLEVYRVSMDLLKHNWLMGIGAGQYESQYKLNAVEVLGKTPYEWVMLHPHNLYLSLWLSLGIFGLILFLLMIGDTVQVLLRTQQWVFFLPLLYLLLHGMVDTPFWKMDMILLFVMLYMVNSRDSKPIDSTHSR